MSKGVGYTSPRKARMILHDGKVRGKKLSKKQRGMFGALARMRMKAR